MIGRSAWGAADGLVRLDGSREHQQRSLKSSCHALAVGVQDPSAIRFVGARTDVGQLLTAPPNAPGSVVDINDPQVLLPTLHVERSASAKLLFVDFTSRDCGESEHP
jgi:hypothetical protein